MLLLVLRDDLADLGGAGSFDPCEACFVEAVDERSFFLRDQPGDFAGRSCFRIGAVVRAIFRDSFDDFTRGRCFFVPSPDEKFLLVQFGSHRGL
jgi:hypothetical protein